MQLLIDKKDLELLLEKKRDFIGNKVAVDTIVAAVSFFLSVFTANYNQVLGAWGDEPQTIFRLIGVVYMVKIIYDFGMSCRNVYNHNVLEKEIEELNMIQHDHSLIAIRNTYDEMHEKFLVYYDERWDCKLFLNYKTVDRNNEAALIDRISADLQVDKDAIHIQYLTSRVQEKYSVSHKENRVYNHRLYEVVVQQWKEEQEQDFSINGKHYYWMSISEMEHDSNILKKNIEVVDFVKETVR